MEKIYVTLLSRSGEKIEIRRAAAEGAGELLELQSRSIDPAPFAAITKEEIEESAKLDTLLAAFVGNRPVALNIILKNRPSDRSLAPDIGESYDAVATFDGVIVDPEYRGLGLQRIFLGLAIGEAEKWGARKLAATVAPGNFYSRENFRRMGFSELGEFPKYGGVRIIVTKDID